MAQTPGPYWLKTTPSGEHHVCGRNGTIMFRYAADQEACATEHVRRLQKGFTEAEKRIRDAAPDLLEAAQLGLIAIDADIEAREAEHAEYDFDTAKDPVLVLWRERAASIRAAIAKATGAA